MKKLLSMAILIIALVALSLSATHVAAYECEESVNPHGENTPPAGWSTDPGTNPRSGKNPDGFYTIVDRPLPEGATGVRVYYGYEGHEEEWGPFQPGIVVKFTEAPGAQPKQKKIGSTKGQAGAVTWHFTVPSEPTCRVWVDFPLPRGSELWVDSYCFVPPPPTGVPPPP